MIGRLYSPGQERPRLLYPGTSAPAVDPEQYSDPEDIYYDDDYEDEDQYEADLSAMFDQAWTLHIRNQKADCYINSALNLILQSKLYEVAAF